MERKSRGFSLNLAPDLCPSVASWPWPAGWAEPHIDTQIGRSVPEFWRPQQMTQDFRASSDHSDLETCVMCVTSKTLFTVLDKKPMAVRRKRKGTGKQRKKALKVLVKAKRKLGEAKKMQKRLTRFRRSAKRSLDQAKKHFKALA